MIKSALATGSFFGLPEKTQALLCMSPDYIAGRMMLVRAMVLGWHLDVVEASSNPLKGIDKMYDFSAMVPMQVARSLDDLYKIKILIVGGGALPDKVLNKLQNISTQIFGTYGMTETVTHIAVKRLNQSSLRGVTMQQYAKSEDVASIAVQLRKDDHYHTLPCVRIAQDSRGCLVIDAPDVADRQLITNDLVEIISETEFKWLGRYDNIINSGGIKLIPEQIEEKLSAIIKERFFVTGVPDELLGEKLVLLVEKNIDNKKEDYKDTVILSKAKNLLSKYEMPKAIYFLPKFIETKTKKIQRQQTLDLIFKKSSTSSD